MTISVFTPTYNRSHTLPRLYQSLCAQSSKDFEWIVVDDGSTDATQALLQTYIQEGRLTIKYICQENGGKHRAINQGVRLAKADLFFIVDSDDYLRSDAIERILFHYEKVKDNPHVAGVVGMKCYADGQRVGGSLSLSSCLSSLSDFRFRRGVVGDLAEVIRTQVMAQYPFPDIQGEYFCPEAYLWHQIGRDYKLLFFNEGIYICEYLADGLSAKIKKLLRENPLASVMTYTQMGLSDLPLLMKLKFHILYWRYFFHLKKRQRKASVPPGRFFLLVFPVSSLLYLYDRCMMRKEQRG